jgi:hypothetical protein
VRDQRLALNGLHLVDTATLDASGIAHDALLHLLVPRFGGPVRSSLLCFAMPTVTLYSPIRGEF